MKSFGMSVAIASLFAFTLVVSAEEAAEEVTLKCPVSGKDVAAVTADYKGGEVAFCCANCKAAFEKDSAKFAVKANHQLVASKQATQVKCPFTGGKLNPEATVSVAGTEVAFCCNNCKGKASKAEGDELLTLVFSDKAFEKGFEVKKEESDK